MADDAGDILIIGAGLSAFHLYHSIRGEKELKERNILFLDDGKMKEKTWCFWERGNGQWDHLVYKKWERGSFNDQNGDLELNMRGYVYKMIRSNDLIDQFRIQIASDDHARLVHEEVLEVNIPDLEVKTAKDDYTAAYIFDSRFDPAELQNTKKPSVLQHFKGRFVRSNKEIFDPKLFTMMDFNSSKANECTFIYVLPFSKTEALLEYTFFTPDLVAEEEYDLLIDRYIEENFNEVKFETLDSEFGIIPMSSYDFTQFNTANYCRIGTAGGWVKASSGYSFKHAEKKSKRIAENLVKGQNPDHRLSASRFKLYDRIFLSILKNENELGNRIFQEMYRKNRTDSIFRFLDEDSNPFEELRIVTSFNPSPFLRAVRREFL